MSGEKYPAKLVEKVARAIGNDLYGYCDPQDTHHIWGAAELAAKTALDAIPYAAMREALEAIHEISQDHLAPAWQCLENIAATAKTALRAADGEEATNEQRGP